MTPWKLPLLGMAALAGPSLRAAAPVDYLTDVKPIFTQHCVRCHGTEKEEAGLRVDTAENLRTGGDSGSVVKLHGNTESLLLQVVEGTHADIPRMPYKKPALDADQIAILRAWVQQGAPAPENEEPGKFVHWAFVAPRHPAPPTVERRDWPRNAIDQFV